MHRAEENQGHFSNIHLNSLVKSIWLPHRRLREACLYQNGWISERLLTPPTRPSFGKKYCNFFCFRKGNFGMNFRKKLRKGGGGHFRSEKFHCKFSAGATGLRKKSQYFFPKKGRRGGAEAVGKLSGNSSVLVETGFPQWKQVIFHLNVWMVI